MKNLASPQCFFYVKSTELETLRRQQRGEGRIQVSGIYSCALPHLE